MLKYQKINSNDQTIINLSMFKLTKNKKNSVVLKSFDHWNFDVGIYLLFDA